MAETVRIDKWLWAVRFYKTRTQAADACKGGKVKIDGVNAKPSREIKAGDVIELHHNYIRRTVKVKVAAKNRVAAKLVSGLMEDMTPAEEFEKLEMMKQLNQEKRDRGTGRPTKKDRRIIDKIKRL
jgi:ribosome-associated heat shock protein Hsp15